MADDVRIASKSLGTLSICAERYALGRRTYMPSLVCGIIAAHLKEYERKDLFVMIEDIERPLFGDYGDECDKADWMKLLGKLKEEMERRDNAIN